MTKPVNVKVKINAEPQSLKRVDSENKITSKGFVSYRDFVEPEPKMNHQVKMKHLTSLEDFDASSVKPASSTSKGVAMNEKLNKFLQSTVKQNKNYVRPSSSNVLPYDSSTKIVSARQIPNFPPPKLVRQITLQYS